ncbi:hypothetical protein F5Y04DRAFT_283246 [Hypomontagnella monticulosa]|nr:hypothetical protein F5Y04DRAFT_283246 [Hypomontagnella monticulosa]
MPHIPAQKPTANKTGASVPRLQQRQAPKSPVSKDRKHMALKGNAKIRVSAEQWKNVNAAIEKTVDLILSKDGATRSFGPGPGYWEMDEGLGVALVAEIIRAFDGTCSLDNPKLRKQLKIMSRDITQGEFRFPCNGGGVWFRFRRIGIP